MDPSAAADHKRAMPRPIESFGLLKARVSRLPARIMGFSEIGFRSMARETSVVSEWVLNLRAARTHFRTSRRERASQYERGAQPCMRCHLSPAERRTSPLRDFCHNASDRTFNLRIGQRVVARLQCDVDCNRLRAFG